MAVTCRKLSAPACCPAVGQGDDGVVVDGAEGVLAAGLLDGGAQGAEDVVDRRQHRHVGQLRDELLEPVVAYVDLAASDADHPVPGVVVEEEAEQVPADESGGSGEQSSTHRARLGARLVPWPSSIRPDTRLRVSFLAAMEEFRDEGRAGDDTHDRLGLRPVRRHLGDRGGLRGVRPGDARGGPSPASRGLRLPDHLVVGRGGRVRRPDLAAPRAERAAPPSGAATSATTYAAAAAGRDTRPRMLAAVLVEARARGIDPALLTCDADNLASRRVIEANGGVLEDQRRPQAALLGADRAVPSVGGWALAEPSPLESSPCP